jgi:hypothetical protein
MLRIRVVALIIISVLLVACTPQPPPPFDIKINVPPPCTVVVGGQIFLSISGSFSKNDVIEWKATSGAVNSTNPGFSAVYTDPTKAGTDTIIATLTSGEKQTPKSIECKIVPPPVTETPSAPSATATDAPTVLPVTAPPIEPPSTEPPIDCALLRNGDFKLTSPPGLHGYVVAPTPVPPLLVHVPITWEPSHCRLTIQVYMGGVPMREYRLYASGELDTVNLNKSPFFRGLKFPVFIRGDWIEIKIFIDGESSPSDNVHLLYP